MPGDRALTSAVIAVGRALRLSVVAEGVETPEQCWLLREAGCGAAQGDGLARAMTAADFEARLFARRHRPSAAGSAPGN